jgi:hypothetical protein
MANPKVNEVKKNGQVEQKLELEEKDLNKAAGGLRWW